MDEAFRRHIRALKKRSRLSMLSALGGVCFLFFAILGLFFDLLLSFVFAFFSAGNWRRSSRDISAGINL